MLYPKPCYNEPCYNEPCYKEVEVYRHVHHDQSMCSSHMHEYRICWVFVILKNYRSVKFLFILNHNLNEKSTSICLYLQENIRCKMHEKGSYVICRQHRARSACAQMQADQGLYFPFYRINGYCSICQRTENA